MEEIEEAFTLRQFHKALKAANQILLAKSATPYCRRSTKYCCKSIDDGHKFQDQCDAHGDYSRMMTLVIPMHYFPELVPSPMSSPSRSVSSILSQAPISTQVPLHFKVMLKLRSMKQNEECFEEFTAAAAAVIAIQSSFELFKERMQKQRKQKKRGKAVNESNCIDGELIIHLQPFLQFYTTKNQNETNALIPFDVLITFIKFIHAVGYHITCVEMIYSIIDQIMSKSENVDTMMDFNEKGTDVKALDGRSESHWDHDDHHGELRMKHSYVTKYHEKEESTRSQNEIFLNYCHICFHLLFIDILPLIPENQQQQLEYMLKEFNNMVNKSLSIHQRNSREKKQPYLRKLGKTSSGGFCSSSPSLSSLKILNQSIQSLHTHLHRKATIQTMSTKVSILDCLMDVCYLLEEEISSYKHDDKDDQKENNHENSCVRNKNNRESLSSSSLNHISPIVNSLSNRLLMKNTDNGGMEKEEGEKEGVVSRIGKDYIIQPLWTSEERWINRGKVISVGFVAYSILSKRRHVANTTRRLGNTIVAPFQEVASALKSIVRPE